MADPESLFSLEVVVETVENVVVSCCAPAIAFRLLDFPTLVIRAEENTRLWDSTTPGYHKLHSGKSCLFKINKNMLHTRLQSTPLYIMLVDIGDENTKLLASTTISLSNCFENVWQSVERNGLDVPAVDGKKGVFELYNLMGTPVAIVTLSYRIFSLGGTINGHVNRSETLIKSTYCKPLENNTRREKELSRQNQKSTIDENLLPRNSLQKTENTLSDLQCEVGTQADFSKYKERPMKSFNIQSRPPKCTNNKETVNITRPPPLYYNSQSSFMDSVSSVNSKSLGFTQERSLFEKTNDAIDSKEATPRECYQTVSVQTTNEAEVSGYASKLHDERTELSDLPVINALLNELSIAKRNWMGSQLEHHRNEAQSVADLPIVAIFQPDAKSCALKNKINPLSERKVLPKKCMKLPGKGVLVSRNLMKLKKSSLRCGTTKTQKLRENLNKKKAGCINISSSKAEEKRAPTQNNSEKGENFVGIKDKETKEVACQVKMVTSSGAHKNKQEIELRHVGIQCINQKRKKEKLFFSDEDKGNMFVGDSKEDSNKELALTVPESQPEIFLPSEVGLTSHSKSCTSQELVSIKQTYSNFAPPITKNSRYNNDKHSSISEEGKSSSSSIDSELSKKNGLLGKMYSHTKCPLKSPSSSFEHNYSHDNFDSYVSDPITESNASDELNLGISTVERNEQTNRKC